MRGQFVEVCQGSFMGSAICLGCGCNPVAKSLQWRAHIGRLWPITPCLIAVAKTLRLEAYLPIGRFYASL